MASQLPSYELNSEIEADESYFGEIRKGKRGGSGGKVAVFGLLKRGGKGIYSSHKYKDRNIVAHNKRENKAR